jgi:hypothetical protein
MSMNMRLRFYRFDTYFRSKIDSADRNNSSDVSCKHDQYIYEGLQDVPYTSVDISAWYSLPDKDGANNHSVVKFKDFVQYCDKNFGFTDCTSFALMKRIVITEVFAFDEHFKQYGSFIVSLLASMRLRIRMGVGNGD